MEQCPARVVEAALTQEAAASGRLLEAGLPKTYAIANYLPLQLMVSEECLPLLTSCWPVKTYFGSLRVVIPKEAICLDESPRTLVFQPPELLISATTSSLTVGFRPYGQMIQPWSLTRQYVVEAAVEDGLTVEVESAPLLRQKEEVSSSDVSTSA